MGSQDTLSDLVEASEATARASMSSRRARTVRQASAVTLALALASFTPVPAAADSPSAQGAESMQWVPSGLLLGRAMALHDSPARFESELDITTQVVTHIHYVKVAADEEWRAEYPSTWQGEANLAVERADDYMYTNFGIDLRIQSYVQWDTYPDSPRVICGDASGLLHELKLDVGEGTADTVLGLAANLLETGQTHGCQTLDYAVVHLVGATASEKRYNAWTTTQHEYSHHYDASDVPANQRSSHTNDVMEAPQLYPDIWCHQAGWDHFGHVLNAAGTYD